MPGLFHLVPDPIVDVILHEVNNFPKVSFPKCQVFFISGASSVPACHLCTHALTNAHSSNITDTVVLDHFK